MAMAVSSYAEADITPIIGYVLTQPRVAETSDGKYCVNYELVIANATKSDFSLEEIRVVDPSRSDAPIRILKADEIDRAGYIPGADKPVSKIPSGKSGYIRVDLTFDSKTLYRRGRAHHHGLGRYADPNAAATGRWPDRTAKVSAGPAVVIGLLLRARTGGVFIGRWISQKDRHADRRDMGGPERWAVDWIQLVRETSS